VVVEVDGKRIGVSLPAQLVPGGGRGGAGRASTPIPRRRGGGTVGAAATGDAVKAPMQATVVKLAVGDGDKVVKGDLVVVLEAMKMEQPITAHKDGTIAKLAATVGTTVSAGHQLLAIEG
jgi:acetyl-CoA/propionyl-CoA carboxylase biotin carboxyl carrier protein